MAVLTLAELKRHLGAKAPDDEADLSALITAAESAVAAKCGPLEVVAVTKRVRGGGRCLVLPVLPVFAVTTVTGKSGSVVADYDLYAAAGLLESDGTWSEEFYDVVYDAGHDPCPADLKEAVKERARYIWQSRRGPANGIAGSESLNALKRSEELMSPYMQPGFA